MPGLGRDAQCVRYLNQLEITCQFLADEPDVAEQAITFAREAQGSGSSGWMSYCAIFRRCEPDDRPLLIGYTGTCGRASGP